MNTKTEQFQEVDKTTAECEARNAACKEAIELGLDVPWKPTWQALEREKKEKEAEVRREAAKVILSLFSKDEPETTWRGAFHVTVKKVQIQVKPVCSEYGSSLKGWRMEMEAQEPAYNRERAKWIGIGKKTELFLTDEQKAKAFVLFEEMKKRNQDYRERTKNLEAKYQREADFKKSQGNFVSEVIGFSDRWTANENGTVTINGETFTVDQWREIHAMKEKHAQALDALKTSFKTL